PGCRAATPERCAAGVLERHLPAKAARAATWADRRRRHRPDRSRRPSTQLMGSPAMGRCFAVLLMLALAACVPGVAEYTKTEAPAALRLAGATTTAPLSFAPGSGGLSARPAPRP